MTPPRSDSRAFAEAPPAPNPMLAAALWYAANHFPVFPCRGKKPLTTHGFKDASTDEAQIRAWWTAWPDANVAMPTGTVSALIVLDVDPRNGGNESLEKLIAACGALPETAIQNTGGNGRHFVFRHPGERVKSRKLPGYAGLDIKGDGGYIMIAPSVHPETGRAYAWDGASGEKALLAPAEAPEWLLAIARQDQNGGKAPPIPDKIADGEKHYTCVSLAGTMRRRGCGPEEIAAALIALSARFETPVPHENLRKIAESACKSYPPAEQKKQTPKRDQIQFTDGRTILSKELGPLLWRVDGVVRDVGVNFLVGRSKEKKTWMALQIAAAVAGGAPALDRFGTLQAPVAFFAIEDDEHGIQNRLKLLGVPENIAANLHFSYGLFLDADGLVELDKKLAERRFGLVVIDPWGLAAPQRGKNADAFFFDYQQIGNLRALAQKHGVSFLIVHHSRKPSTKGHDESDPLDDPLGSSALVAAADTVMVLRRKGKHVSLTIRGRNTRFEDDLAMSFDLDAGGWRIVGTAADAEMSDQRRRILEVLAQHPMTPREVAAALGKKPDSSTVRSLLSRMLDDDQVEKLHDGRYAIADPQRHFDLTGADPKKDKAPF